MCQSFNNFRKKYFHYIEQFIILTDLVKITALLQGEGQNYQATANEALAVVWTIEKFRQVDVSVPIQSRRHRDRPPKNEDRDQGQWSEVPLVTATKPQAGRT